MRKLFLVCFSFLAAAPAFAGPGPGGAASTQKSNLEGYNNRADQDDDVAQPVELDALEPASGEPAVSPSPEADDAEQTAPSSSEKPSSKPQ